MSPVHLLHTFALMTGLLIGAVCVLAQPLQIGQRVSVSGPAVFSANQYGNLFVGDAKGAIWVYDSTGTAINSFSPLRAGRVTTIEAWQGLRVFCFYRELQEYVMLDRFLAPLPGYGRLLRINAAQVGFARLATLANDGQLWLFDDTDFSLKKYDPVTGRVSLHISLELVIEGDDHQFITLREYQNLIFLQDALSGVLVFDNAGNFRNKIALSSASSFGLFEDELYFVDAGQLVFVHLYNQKRHRFYLPNGVNPLSITIGPSRIFILTEKEILVCPKPL